MRCKKFVLRNFAIFSITYPSWVWTWPSTNLFTHNTNYFPYPQLRMPITAATCFLRRETDIQLFYLKMKTRKEAQEPNIEHLSLFVKWIIIRLWLWRLKLVFMLHKFCKICLLKKILGYFENQLCTLHNYCL